MPDHEEEGRRGQAEEGQSKGKERQVQFLSQSLMRLIAIAHKSRLFSFLFLVVFLFVSRSFLSPTRLKGDSSVPSQPCNHHLLHSIICSLSAQDTRQGKRRQERSRKIHPIESRSSLQMGNRMDRLVKQSQVLELINCGPKKVPETEDCFLGSRIRFRSPLPALVDGSGLVQNRGLAAKNSGSR